MSIMLYNVVLISASEYEFVIAIIRIKATEQYYTPFSFFIFIFLR